MVPRGNDGGRDSWGIWDQCVHTLILKMDNQQGPTVQHVGSAQCYVAAWMGGAFGEEWTRVCMTESVCYAQYC